MLTVTITLLTAIYLIGPGFLTRYILGFVVPRKTVNQTKSEEIARSVLTALVPLALALIWIARCHVISWTELKPNLQTVFSGLYSDKIFECDPPKFFAAAKAVWWANWYLIWRLYVLLLSYSLGLNLLIRNYGSIRNWKWITKIPWFRNLLATFVLPRVSEWYVLLTVFSHKKSTRVSADVLTKTDVLYRGIIEEPFLAPDGSLSGLLLSEPRRYDRKKLIDDRQKGKIQNTDTYWRSIPSNTFLIMAADISTINLRRYTFDKALFKQLQQILDGKKVTATTSILSVSSSGLTDDIKTES